MEASLAVSYGCLEPDLQRRFRALGVFAPAPFDLAALAALWGDKDEAAETGLDLDAAEDAARLLVRRGVLARTESRLEGGTEDLAQPA